MRNSKTWQDSSTGEQIPRLLIRADAGPRVGTGHIMRTLALGQAWKRDGGQVTFVCGQLPGALIKRIEQSGFQVFQIQNYNCDGADAKDTQEIISVVQPQWIVLDGYRFGNQYQRTVRNSASKLLVIDDYGHASHENADVILNQNSYASSKDYGDRQARVLAGSQFALLRNEFVCSANSSIETKRIPAEARRILVTFGGADADNWTLKALQAIDDLGKKRLIVDCVVGACYAHTAELEMFKKTTKLSLRLHRNVDRMDLLMMRADLAVTAGGSTCYELSRCGVPSIVASIAENQIPISRSMDEQGAMISVDEVDGNGQPSLKLNGSLLKKALKKLISHSEQRRSLSNRSMNLVDGKGAQRIIRAMNAGTFSIRAATTNDIETMWQWRNDPEVRSVLMDGKPVSLSNFSEATTKTLSDPRNKILIAIDSRRQPIAQISFSLTESKPNEGQTYKVDVIVDQARRGRGLGTVLISQACEEHFEDTDCEMVIAQAKPGNIAFEKAFRSAGFKGIEPVIINGKIAMQLAMRRNNFKTQTESVARKKSA